MFISIARVSLIALALFLFPAVALAAWRAGGARRLTLAVFLALGVVVAFALLAANPRFGNALSPTHGYWPIARNALVVFGLLLGTPIVAGAVAVRVLGPKKHLPGYAIYATAVGAASLGWIAAIFGSLLLWPLLA